MHSFRGGIGFMALLDITKRFAPSQSLPWSDGPISTNTRAISYVFVILGILSIISATATYFVNQNRIVHRLFGVGQGWAGYTMALFIMIFACFIMILALREGS
jgi:uncharacterized membrane protein YidH (DUF202 family)